MAEFWGKGIELGLKGKQLTEFVESQTRLLAQREERQAQREREEKERQAQREREERQAQSEERQAQREREERQAQREERQAQREERERQIELKRLELQIEMETKRLELQTEMVRVQNEHEAPRQRDNQQQMLHRAPKLPAFADGKDQIDCYLARFERFAESARWQRDDWAIQLSAHLTGAALEVYTRLSNDDARDYDVLKEALLRCYNFTERGYRQRFRECQPLSGETPSQFVERLSSYLQKWVELSGEEQSYESLRDLIVKEQFLNACPKDLATRLEEQKLRGLKDITDAAERYLIAHGRTLGTSKSSKPFQKSGNQGNQPAKGQTESAPSSNEGQNITCFHCNAKGHRVANCPQKKNNGHDNDKAQEHRRRYYDNKRQTSDSNQQVCASSVILPRAA
ncbi:trichohyalin-like [Littorina saxatilis]|uniref:trichohyalin-like n=1 Tax=Littorina saxatilis TaxID=31220 RepID=UPI0038B44B5A